MKTVTPALRALLDSHDAWAMADLLTITPPGSPALRLCGADVDVIWNGNTWVSSGVLFSRGRTRLARGLEVDTLDLTLRGTADTLVYGAPLVPFGVSGGFDAARVRLERAFAADWASPIVGVVHLFEGRVSDCDALRDQLRMTVKSDLELLNTQLPRVLYQAGCANTLYDSACGVSRAAFAVASSCAAGSTTTRVMLSLNQASGYFDQGVIEFVGGANSGQRRTIKQFVSGGYADLVLPLPAPPTAGDGVSLVPGCDKKQSTCSAKFSNLARFRGFPYLPRQEALTGKPLVKPGGGSTGGGSHPPVQIP